ncbi:hypothetical protein FNH22_27365 [Fulvivirga sp. M361]|uniref:TonB-dependent receptor n=1 Tax=Fulvivirga sp. M361 TaxID=2594266 RepID=UPI00117A9FF1|nr:TonB-dependent receptor [Fulvivirga sp. M361]TRX49347.1 hypothetical protein FNH22_27365 [Fulvivirga sp. M361]
MNIKYIIIGIVCLLQSAGIAFAQPSFPALERRISIEVHEKTLQEVLTQIQESGEFQFAYRYGAWVEEKVSVSAKDETVREVLVRLLKNKGLTFSDKGQNRILILRKEKERSSKTTTFSGYVKDESSGESLIGCVILIKGSQGKGAVTNAYGFFSITLPAGLYEFQVSYIGYQTQFITRQLEESMSNVILLKPLSEQLEEVVVTGSLEEDLYSIKSLGKENIAISRLDEFPALAGEPDVIKLVHEVPGVQTAGEGSTEFYVRGGNLDQNLILLDEAIVYNPTHLLGFFSVFNPDAIKHVEFYKGPFPIQYGGRLSSVMDVRMKEGNKEKFSGSGGIGLLSSRLTLEGPLKKEKSSFIFSARRTYPDLILRALPDDGGNKMNFTDLTAKINTQIGKYDQLYLSGYIGKDVFRFFDQFENEWGNTTGTLRWNHVFSPRLFSNFTVSGSQYRYFISNIITGQETFNWESGITDWQAKADFSWFPRSNHEIRFGIQSIHHKVEPGEEGTNKIASIEAKKNLESAAYIGHYWNISPRFSLDYGLRYNLFNSYGPQTVINFDENNTPLDTTLHRAGELYQTYEGLEPRIGLSYQLMPSVVLKMGYQRNYQFIQQIRNSVTSFNAFFIWLPSGPSLKPQFSDQISWGVFKVFSSRKLSLNLEGYYKKLHRQIGYPDHAQLLQNPNVESLLRFGDGTSYGIELSLHKETKKFSSTLAYTYSKTELKIPEINNGVAFPAYYDQPHSISFVTNYQLSERLSLSSNWVYQTGRPVTLPAGSYRVGESTIPVYERRYGERLPDYHRLDVSAKWKGKMRTDRRWESFWLFSLTNLYFRKNALSIDFMPVRDRATGNVPDRTDVRPIKTFIFGLIPSLSYNFKF